MFLWLNMGELSRGVETGRQYGLRSRWGNPWRFESSPRHIFLLMQIEFEATFLDIDKDVVRAKLKSIGAKLIHPEILMKRDIFDPPKLIAGGWLRVRKEFDCTTMSLKVVDGNKIENQKEIELRIDDYESGVEFLKTIGAVHKSYQETKRELWHLRDVKVTIDTWPGLRPFVEVESDNEASVRSVSAELGLDYLKAYFGSVDGVYKIELGIEPEVINALSTITFENPPRPA